MKIRASHVTYKMNPGYLSGKGRTDNTVTLTYATYGNYLDARYTLSKLDVRAGASRNGTLGYDPNVRTSFDAVLKITLAVPYRSRITAQLNQPPLPIGPVRVTAVSVRVSNLRFVGGRHRAEAADIDGVISNLGNRSYWWQECIGCDYLDGKPFPTWTPWLQSSLRSLLGVAAPAFSSISVMNYFLNASQTAGANTSKLGYSSFDGVSLVTSGPAILQIKGNTGLPGVQPRRR